LLERLETKFDLYVAMRKSEYVLDAKRIWHAMCVGKNGFFMNCADKKVEIEYSMRKRNRK